MPTKTQKRDPGHSDVPLELNEALVRELALLSNAPPGIAESTIALLGLGSRAMLEQLDLIELCGERAPFIIKIKPYGWHVINECARWVEQATADDWRTYRSVDGLRAHYAH
jgi:hypothetical protein